MTDKTKLAEALNPSFVVELPPNTKSVKYNVPMAMMPLSDWEKIEAALAPCEGAAMAAEVERLRGALEEIHGYVDCGRHGAIERIIKAALAGGKEG